VAAQDYGGQRNSGMKPPLACVAEERCSDGEGDSSSQMELNFQRCMDLPSLISEVRRLLFIFTLAIVSSHSTPLLMDNAHK